MAGHSATRSKGGWQPCQVQASRFFIEGYTPTGGPHPQSHAKLTFKKIPTQKPKKIISPICYLFVALYNSNI